MPAFTLERSTIPTVSPDILKWMRLLRLQTMKHCQLQTCTKMHCYPYTAQNNLKYVTIIYTTFSSECTLKQTFTIISHLLLSKKKTTGSYLNTWQATKKILHAFLLPFPPLHTSPSSLVCPPHNDLAALAQWNQHYQQLLASTGRRILRSQKWKFHGNRSIRSESIPMAVNN